MYGRNARGEAARAGGWGHMIGDEGSGYWIGREALAAVMRASDGRGPATRLTARDPRALQRRRRVAAAADRLRPRAAARERRGARPDRRSGPPSRATRWRCASSSVRPRSWCWPRGRWRRASRCAATRSRSTWPAASFASCRGWSTSCRGGSSRSRRAAQVQTARRGAGGRRRLARARRSARRRAGARDYKAVDGRAA